MKLLTGLRRLLFVFASATIMIVGSERMFWYYAKDWSEQAVLALFYAPAAGGVLWLMHRYRVRDLWGLLLVVPVYAYLIEGVVTPVMYTGGPFVPFFPVWFGFWHGFLAVVVLFYLFRKWLLAEAWKPLLACATGMGAFWGTWAITSGLPENLEDPDIVGDLGHTPQALTVSEFASYSFGFSAVLAAAHLALGSGLWMSRFEPSKATKGLWLAGTAAMVAAWTIAIPWAGPMFAAYVGLQIWGLRRHREAGVGPTLMQQLAGRVRLRALAPLVAMPAAATLAYAEWTAFDPTDEFVRNYLWLGTICVQALLGAGYMVVSLWRARRPASTETRPPRPVLAGAASGR